MLTDHTDVGSNRVEDEMELVGDQVLLPWAHQVVMAARSLLQLDALGGEGNI